MSYELKAALDALDRCHRIEKAARQLSGRAFDQEMERAARLRVCSRQLAAEAHGRAMAVAA